MTDFVLPLVSVIIVNYNYGRFIADAVASVFAQRYTNVECFVVDNNSTDESRDVLEGLLLKYHDLHAVFRPSNDGQCVASAEIFPRTRGQYVVFLDADDVLLPDFIGTHVYVALSLYRHVGFTCCDMVQAVGNEIVLSTSLVGRPESTERPQDAKSQNAKSQNARLMRPLAPSIWSAEGLAPVAESELQFVPRDETDWRWTATSAFMFRRDALALFIENPRFKTLRCALDVYFARGINAITGSVVIDRSLCIYRMHGSNIFSRHAHLDRCLNFEIGGKFDQNMLARRALIDLWFASARVMIKRLRIEEDFIDGIQTLNDAIPRLRDANGRSYAAGCLLAYFEDMRETVGLPTLLKWCLRLRVSPLAIARRPRRQPARQLAS